MSANLNDPRVLEQIRALSGGERVRIGMECEEILLACMTTRLRRQYPMWSDAEVRAAMRVQFDRRKLELDEWDEVEQALFRMLLNQYILKKGAAAAPHYA